MIRQIKPGNFKSVFAIHKSLVLNVDRINETTFKWQVQKNGFLVGEYSRKDLEKDLNKTFLVSEAGRALKGYIRIDDRQEFKDTENKIWLLPKLKDVYYSSPHAEIGVIAVNKESRGKGVAKELLYSAIERLKQDNIAYLFSIIPFSPLTNFPSMMFFEKHGFKKIALSLPSRLFGIDNYQSFLYVKVL